MFDNPSIKSAELLKAKLKRIANECYEQTPDGNYQCKNISQPEEYLPVKPALAEAKKRHQAVNSHLINNAAVREYSIFNFLSESTTLVDDIEAQLRELGIHKLNYLGSGAFAVAMETMNHQVVRIVKKDTSPNKETDRSTQPQAVQAIKTIHFISNSDDNIQIEILPRLLLLSDIEPEISLNEDEKNVLMQQMHTGLREDTYGLWDMLKGSNNQLKTDNIALLPDGTPVILDPGAVFHRYTTYTLPWQPYGNEASGNYI